MKTRLETLREIHGDNNANIKDFDTRYYGEYNAAKTSGAPVSFETDSNKAFFKTVYMIQLKRCHAQFPNDYLWPESELMPVFQRMCAAIDRVSFNKDSAAFKLTCKAIGIKHTYKAISDFINS